MSDNFHIDNEDKFIFQNNCHKKAAGRTAAFSDLITGKNAEDSYLTKDIFIVWLCPSKFTL